MTPERAIELARSIVAVEVGLNDKYDAWLAKAKSSGESKEVMKAMENLHSLVLDYIYGLLGGDIQSVVQEVLNIKE